MVRVEIELLSEINQDDIYDLRNYLNEKLPDAGFIIKEQPPAPGQMGDDILSMLVGGLTHASTAIVAEELYHNLLKPLFLEWKMSRKQKGKHLELMSSLTENSDKVHFLEDNDGKTEVYNYKYAINTEKTFVLLIGVGEFSKDFRPIPPVKGNLEDLFKMLADKTHIGIPRENISTSFNESHVEIQKRLLEISRKPDAQTLLIYFAGHGHRTDVKKLSLVASDTEKIDDEVIGGIDFDFISNKVLKNSPARQKILILDTCHSGIATQGTDDLTANFDVKGSYILTSSPGDDVSYFEKNERNTYFTGALLDALENGVDNTNEMLALEDLYDYTKDVMTEKKFPQPNEKSDLNIPASGFFIARNPSFSPDKLKWRAYNLFRDGKLEDALDEFRLLLKRFPDDGGLRKQFEECETEFSFSKLVNEANTLFYQQKNYTKAAELYRKAYQLKKDALVMEKLRECEKQPAGPPVPDPIANIKANTDYIAFQNALGRKSFYTAYQYLKKVKQAFPGDNYVNEEFLSLEKKLIEISDGRKDERLINYYSYLDSGNLQQALAELKVQISNDPEHPIFLQLQKNLLRQIKEQQQQNEQGQQPLLFQLFKTFNIKWKTAVLIVLGGIILLLVVMYLAKNMEKSRIFKKGEGLYLSKHYDEAYPLLVEAAHNNNSIAMVDLGYMFEDKNWWKHSLDSAESWYRLAVKYNDNAKAFNELARMFMLRAIDGAPNYDSAYYLLQRAKDLDPSLGEVFTNLGIVYEHGGYNIRQSKDSAIYYYRIAAARGRPIAKDALKRLGVSE